jgi:phage terminase small subunit
MAKTVKKYETEIRKAVQATGRYTEADETLIRDAALVRLFIDQAIEEVEALEGFMQVFEKTKARQIAPEINNLRGLMSDYRKYCNELGLSPSAREKMDIKVSEKKASSLRSLRPPKAANE